MSVFLWPAKNYGKGDPFGYKNKPEMLILNCSDNDCKIPPILKCAVVSDGCLKPLWKKHYLKFKK